MHYVYVLGLERIYGFYIGISCNLERRLQQHYAGEGAAVTKKYGIETVVSTIPCGSRAEALELECRLVLIYRDNGKDAWGGSWTRPSRNWAFPTKPQLERFQAPLAQAIGLR